jgi:hypothetical protein
VGCNNPCLLCGAHFVATPFKGKPISLSTVSLEALEQLEAESADADLECTLMNTLLREDEKHN